MYGVPQAGLTVPAVAGQLERGVRPQRGSTPPVNLSDESLPRAISKRAHAYGA